VSERRKRRLQRRLSRRADGWGECGGCRDGGAQAGWLVRDAGGGYSTKELTCVEMSDGRHEVSASHEVMYQSCAMSSLRSLNL
jgi:hypothetical protein